MSDRMMLDEKALAHAIAKGFCARRAAGHLRDGSPYPCGRCCSDAEQLLSSLLPSPAVPPRAEAVLVEPLCEDEGCPHHGSLHVCASRKMEDVTRPSFHGFTVMTCAAVPEGQIWMAPTPDYAERLADAVDLFNASRTSSPEPTT